jgi:hypothetical protein
MQFLGHLYGFARRGRKGKVGGLGPDSEVSANKAVPKNTADRAEDAKQLMKSIEAIDLHTGTPYQMLMRQRTRNGYRICLARRSFQTVDPKAIELHSSDQDAIDKEYVS